MNIILTALTICQDEDAQKLQLALAQKASLLRTVCDEASGLEMDFGRISTMTARKRIAQDRRKGKWTKHRLYYSCSTLIREKASTYSIGGAKIFKTSMECCKHSIDCPFYIRTEVTNTVGLKMVYLLACLDSPACFPIASLMHLAVYYHFSMHSSMHLMRASYYFSCLLIYGSYTRGSHT